jgi:hypothetical protein
MRARQGSRVRHAEQTDRSGRILRLLEMWDASARRWEPAAEVDWGEGRSSLHPLRDLVLVRREPSVQRVNAPESDGR